jgi:hypothetical protein
MYKNILKISTNEKNWLFIHYNQVLTPEGGKLISEHASANFDFSFPEKQLKRSVATGRVPDHINETYNKLCELAGISTSISERF